MKCCRCENEMMMQVMLPIGEVTESGKIVFPNENKHQSVQIPIPLCYKCMIYAEQGWITPVKFKEGLRLTEIADNKSDFGIKFFEDRYKIGELTKDIEESLHGETRSQVKKQKMKNTPLRIAIIVEEAIKLQEKFNEELKKKSSELTK